MFLPILACAVFFVRPSQSLFEKDPNFWWDLLTRATQDWRDMCAQHEQKSDPKINRTPHRSQNNATNREIIMLSKWFGKPRSQTKDNTKVECPQLSLRPSKEGNKVAILASGWFWVRAHCFGRVIIGIWNDSPSFLPGTATQVWENNRSCAVYCGILGR